MPRRQALRAIGATLALGAFRALRPGTASASAGSQPACTGECGPVNKACCVQVRKGTHHGGCCRPDEECCIGPNDIFKPTDQMSWCCAKGMCRTAGGQCIRRCTADQEECQSQCCSRGWYCADKPRSRCCQDGEAICVVPKSGMATCCKPGTTCCFNATDAKCCSANQTCVNGDCKCAAGQTTCGSACCAKNEPCLGGKCCPSTKVDCSGTCCDKGLCCQLAGRKMCCPPGQFCATIAGAPGNNNCCPKARIVVTASGKPVCCGIGLVAVGPNCCPPGNPNCCDASDLQTLCARNQICVSGSCVSI